MGDLFWNKVFGVIIAGGLVVMGLMELSHYLVHAKAPERMAYYVDMSAIGTTTVVEEEEPELDFSVLLASADAGAGERVSRRCASCHSFEEGGANMTGPAMWGVVGREVAGVDGYGYSGAMEEYAESNPVWGYENLNAYLESPSGYISGTAMSFAGLRDPEDRANIIAYMRTLSANPMPLPEVTAAEEAPAEAAEEVAEDAVEG